MVRHLLISLIVILVSVFLGGCASYYEAVKSTHEDATEHYIELRYKVEDVFTMYDEATMAFYDLEEAGDEFVEVYRENRDKIPEDLDAEASALYYEYTKDGGYRDKIVEFHKKVKKVRELADKFDENSEEIHDLTKEIIERQIKLHQYGVELVTILKDIKSFV